MTAETDTDLQAPGDAPPAASVRLVVGYDGSAPATRALDAAVALLRGRNGTINVVYIAHVPAVDMMSADALAQVESDFDLVETELRASAAAQLDGRGVAWEFRRRQGLIVQELIAAAAATGDAHPGDTVAIVVGSSSQGGHRIVGSVAVGLARHCPVPLVIVPLGPGKPRARCCCSASTRCRAYRTIGPGAAPPTPADRRHPLLCCSRA